MYICLSLSDFTYYDSLGSPRSLQMASFHPFYDCVVFHCVYMYHILFIHSSTGVHLGHSTSWLLQIVLLWK